MSLKTNSSWVLDRKFRIDDLESSEPNGLRQERDAVLPDLYTNFSREEPEECKVFRHVDYGGGLISMFKTRVI